MLIAHAVVHDWIFFPQMGHISLFHLVISFYSCQFTKENRSQLYICKCVCVYECLRVCTCVCVVGRVCVVDPVGDALKWAILIQNSAVSLRDPFLQIQLRAHVKTIYNLMYSHISLSHSVFPQGRSVTPRHPQAPGLHEVCLHLRHTLAH